MKSITLSDIEEWINNDEGLYNWKRRSKLSMRKFIQENRHELETCIRNVRESEKPAHYLAYGG